MNHDEGPESSAERVALWRAMHLTVDQPPHVIEDDIGRRLASPAADWQNRPDMHPDHTRLFRMSIVARSRFIDDLFLEQFEKGIDQFVILGAGLDTFAQRKPDVASRTRIFEVDKQGPQIWKHRRLIELGYGVPAGLIFVPVDFESGEVWSEKLRHAGLDAERPAVIACAGVSLYLRRDAVADMLRQAAAFAAGSTLAMTYLLPRESVEGEERAGLEASERGARSSGTPFVSFFTREEILTMARAAGFGKADCVSGADLAARYFAARPDGFRPGKAEEILVARTGS
jgi:methyltransferase (TIGR00027 family)